MPFIDEKKGSSPAQFGDEEWSLRHCSPPCHGSLLAHTSRLSFDWRAGCTVADNATAPPFL